MNNILLPIALDIETSGGNPLEYGIWQVGAVDLNTMEEFIEESRIDDKDKIDEEALRITGKSENELRDKNKKSQKEMIRKFFEWLNKRKMKNLLCHNPQFDQAFLSGKAVKYFKKEPFFPDNHRAFDLHTIAEMKFFELNKKFLTKEDNNSDMGLRNILKLCGIEDERRGFKEGKFTEGKPHNALNDARLNAECFSRLIFGESLFNEYSEFKIPEELKK